MKKLDIIDLHVEIDGIEIIKGINLTFYPNKIHALMGPNGSGKSTLAKALMGHPKYKITKGKILLDGEDITYEKPDIRAKKGLFLSFQYPKSINGITISNLLRTAVKNIKKENLSVIEFHNRLKEKMKELKIDPSLSKRYINTGFSGGEKKRAEILQLSMIQPKYAFLDETDSGLDIDAIKIVAEGINAVKNNKEMSVIVITHYNRFLDYLMPNEVSVLYKGKIIAQGKYDLAKKIENEGFEGVIENSKNLT
jgi:Fe-S cluster assembly ATP-binding protein